MSQVKDTTRRFIAENFALGTGEFDIGDGDSLLDSQLLDSTGFMELIEFIHAEFGVVVADHEMLPENLDSLDAIDAFVARKRSA